MSQPNQHLEQRTDAHCKRLDSLPIRELQGGLRLATAATRTARVKGLARLDDMPARYGLLIPKCRSVHTFTMRFELDLVWLNKKGELVRIDHNVPPRRVRSCLRAHSVIELNAGKAERFIEAAVLDGVFD